ncbi:hypothetical protein L596_011997 [Steinernema carpocapsae]|uniref:Uncharacterized protein n=1 Tax=Steinernema carpocapsae TaxID=34508 RepID=A0A4U5NVN7_STECR|nr:hypothetical protein L596_011997 [Steinernema carpocapsae]
MQVSLNDFLAHRLHPRGTPAGLFYSLLSMRSMVVNRFASRHIVSEKEQRTDVEKLCHFTELAVASQVDIGQPTVVVVKGRKATKTSDRKMEATKAIEKREEEGAMVEKTQDEEEVAERKDSGTVATTTTY